MLKHKTEVEVISPTENIRTGYDLDEETGEWVVRFKERVKVDGAMLSITPIKLDEDKDDKKLC